MENNNPDNGMESLPTAYTPAGVKNLLDQKYKGAAHVLLTKEVVDYLLTLNINNRKIKPPRVQEYYSQFKYFGFHDCRAFMTVTETERLVDGQHRLLALQQLYNEKDSTLKPSMQFIAFGEKDDVLLEIDNGCTRSYSDTLVMTTDIENLPTAAAVKYYCMYRTGRKHFSPTEIFDAYTREFKDFCKLGDFPALPQGSVSKANKQVPAWVILAFKFAYDEFGMDVVSKAYDQFYNGTDIREPFVALRYILLSHKGMWRFNNISIGDKLMGYVFNAFNRLIKGELVPKAGLRSSKLDKSLKKNLQQTSIFAEAIYNPDELDSSKTVCYGKYRFRSKLEAQWALFLDNADIKYVYQPEENPDSVDKYLPDFFLPEENVWLEIRPQDDIFTDVQKYEDFGKMLVAYEELLVCFGLPQIDAQPAVSNPKKVVPGIVGYAYDEEGIKSTSLEDEDLSTWVIPSMHFPVSSWQPTKASVEALRKAARDASKAFK